MTHKETKKIFDQIVNNEFLHISEFKEYEDLKENKEIVNIKNEKEKIYEKLYKVAPGHSDLIDDLDSAECDYWCMIARYYFKMGIIAGATNLNFTNKLI
ncbi:hypothetical protein FDB75_06500 [Clostridium botulinum]|uniref:hypothetical protein n=1 Tax=Clostridium botulinum TaxID=1491 RepID=UPI0007746D43|nr:hypothetical protein [Clostridium botulinum]MBN1053071.1 hypothetical protein [Clostridium botulinum]NFE84008.1 hypothetical protein [Clostridium botulinum]NFN28096.1 hypothetical protein [Clostridium botulinum]NFO49947.1 hypothetical protein [Clostridium botulinum]